MSVFGGDSWAREAQYRKRRVDDLMLDSVAPPSSTSYKKLASGKFVCLVCSHNPLLDTPLVLSMHIKSARHCAAEEKAKERELERQSEMNKRIALSRKTTSISNNVTPTRECKLGSKPLIECTRKAAYQALNNSTRQRQTNPSKTNDVRSSCDHTTNGSSGSNSRFSSIEAQTVSENVQQVLDYKQLRERELKFIEAGWKRNGHGSWFRDENVEFDSDEEDPNVSFA